MLAPIWFYTAWDKRYWFGDYCEWVRWDTRYRLRNEIPPCPVTV